ncbi:DUF669 domain-containing protein [Rhizobium laguerreae]|uniref:DUF669 domain-containing protein n=1 Tax=Rhizobium laguerreae TaxID=1076926 RepID=UPI001C905D31|nr:DUF669 domain-containing protein [Rhizobium laguerreae]MBY3543629.1 DUF669 domain-containing protein [Rhizobium laguerreae]
MARLGNTFNATEHDTEQNDFELLPNGTYKLEVTASDLKEEGNNLTLAITYDVVEPEQYKSRKIFAYIDLQHNESDKQERGQREFAKLCRAVSLDNVDDSEELHFLPFFAKVKRGEAGVSKAGRAYKARNSIQRFFYPTDDQGNPVDAPEPAIDANQPARAAPANDNRPAPAAAKPAAAAAPAGRRPWGK